MTDSPGIFAKYAPMFRDRGFEPRPVIPGEKHTPIKKWQRPDDDFSRSELESWLTRYAHHGVGLRTGTRLPDNTYLGAVDIDHEDFVRLAQAALRNPICGRVGARGIAFMVRVQAIKASRVFKIQDESGSAVHVGELLVDGRFCVMPPTVHPEGMAYRWVGQSLLDIDYRQLPLIEG